MDSFTTASGATVEIGLAGWDEASALRMALERALISHGSAIEDVIKSVAKNGIRADAMELLPLIIKLDSDQGLNEKIWPCLARCKRNGDKITKATFEEEGAREDYYEIVGRCVWRNIIPFFKGILSKLSASQPDKKADDTQK
jgi:hypothetical protein